MVIIFSILLAAAARFIPHMPNFAPITALAIFSAAHLGWKRGAVITLGARLVSDMFLGFFAWPIMLAVYASHLAGVLLGFWIKRTSQNNSWPKIILASLGSSAIFFLVTNFAFLYSSYPHNLEGVVAAYVNGLPFLRGTLTGDLAYTVLMFGAAQALAAYRGYKKTFAALAI